MAMTNTQIVLTIIDKVTDCKSFNGYTHFSKFGYYKVAFHSYSESRDYLEKTLEKEFGKLWFERFKRNFAYVKCTSMKEECWNHCYKQVVVFN